MPKTPTLTERPASEPGAIVAAIYIRAGGQLEIRTQLTVDGLPQPVLDRFLANEITAGEAGITNAQRNAYLTAIYTKAVARWMAREGI